MNSKDSKFQVIQLSVDEVSSFISGKSRMINTLAGALQEFPVNVEIVDPDGFSLQKFALKVFLSSYTRISKKGKQKFDFFLNQKQPFLTRNFKRKLQSFEDKFIVHAHSFQSHLFIRKLSIPNKFKTVCTIHSMGAVAKELKLDGSFSENPQLYKSVSNMELESLMAADVIVTPSEASKNALLRDYPSLRCKKLIVIYNPVTINFRKRFTRKDFRISDSDFVAVTASKLKPIKRIDLLIKAIREIKQELTNFKLLIIGKGPEFPKLKKLIDKYKLSGNVKLLGAMENAVDVINLADVVVMASEQENLPTLLVEGLLLGKPLVAFNVGGINEIINNNKNGFLVDFGDVHEFSDKLIALRKDLKLRKTFGRKSFELSKKFSPKLIAAKYYRVYKNLYESLS